ncbi:MAG: hypothetical protein EOO52_13035 [Gammaproteobacteria bacterium]|nr:MAG: hypothetical protein EOO52_13035 [Gammaproteobacteria bacterium]
MRKHKAGPTDIYIDGVNFGVFDDIDGKIAFFPKRNEKLTGDHYILIGRALNKLNGCVSKL